MKISHYFAFRSAGTQEVPGVNSKEMDKNIGSGKSHLYLIKLVTY